MGPTSEKNYKIKLTADGVEIPAVERKFIHMYKQMTHLWNPQHPFYNDRFKRNTSYDVLLKILRRIMPTATRSHVRQKINVLRSCYRKDLRKYLASRTVTDDGKVVNTYMPGSWKFHALRFLDCDEDYVDDNSIEMESSPENCEEEYNIPEPELDSANEELESSKLRLSPIYIEEKPISQWISNGIDDSNLLEREYNAIGANVSCKLQRMNPQQRYHAELLINKVLIHGLKEKLTEETDLTDVWRIDDMSHSEKHKDSHLNNKSNDVIEV